MPFLLRGLELDDSDLRSSIIDVINEAASEEAPESKLISEYASSLVSIMLKIVGPSNGQPVVSWLVWVTMLPAHISQRVSDLLHCGASEYCPVVSAMMCFTLPNRMSFDSSERYSTIQNDRFVKKQLPRGTLQCRCHSKLCLTSLQGKLVLLSWMSKRLDTYR